MVRQLREEFGRQKFKQMEKHIQELRGNLETRKQKGLPLEHGLWDPKEMYYPVSLLTHTWAFDTSFGAIMKHDIPKAGNISPKNQPIVAQALVMAIAWRESKAVYHVHPALAEELTKTSLSKIPTEILSRLPHWCIFIPYRHEHNGLSLDGFWVMRDEFVHPKKEYILRLALKFRTPGKPARAIIDMIAIFIRDTLEESIRATREHKEDGIQINDLMPKYTYLERVLNLLLYVCSKNAELGAPQTRIRPIRKKKPGWECVPNPMPQKPVVWRCGWRIGAALKKAQEAEQNNRSISMGGKVRPHVRRAHWHLYWCGRGRSRPEVKWVSPIMVRGPESVVTLHKTN
jgi:hypothetical protein